MAAASILPLNGDVLPFNVTGLPKTLKKRREERNELIGSGLIHENANPPDRHRLRLRLSGDRRKNEAENENDREPDQPHGHLGGGWLAGV